MRAHRVDKARTSRKHRKVCRCGHEIQPGESYWYADPRYGARKIRCTKHPFRPSELTSGKRADLLAEQESLEDALSDFQGAGLEADPSDLAAAMEDAAGNIRNTAEEYNQSADNIEEYFTGGSSQADELREKGEAAEQWADELDNAASDIREAGVDERAALEEARTELNEYTGDDEDERHQLEQAVEEAEQALETVLEEAASTAEEAINSWSD